MMLASATSCLGPDGCAIRVCLQPQLLFECQPDPTAAVACASRAQILPMLGLSGLSLGDLRSLQPPATTPGHNNGPQQHTLSTLMVQTQPHRPEQSRPHQQQQQQQHTAEEHRPEPRPQHSQGSGQHQAQPGHQQRLPGSQPHEHHPDHMPGPPGQVQAVAQGRTASASHAHHLMVQDLQHLYP